MTKIRHLISTVLLIASVPVAADRPYAVGISLAVDSADGRSFGGLIDYSLSDSTSIALDASIADAEGFPVDIRTSNWEASVTHDFNVIGVEASFGQSGDRDEFTSDDWSLGLFKSLGSWRLSVGVLNRDFELTYRSVVFPEQSVRASVKADGIRTAISYTTASGAGVFAANKHYDYNRNVTRLNQLRIARLLSPSTLTLSGSLLDHSTSVGLDWPVGEQILSLSLARDRTAVDRIDVDSVTLGWLTPLGARSDLDIGVGISRDNFDTQYFVTLLFLRYGGID